MKTISGLILLLFSVMTSAASINKIVVFGDSLSDNGNFYEYMKHQIPMSPPYFKGRFSNGPVWIEYLSEFYFPNDPKAHLLDYAFGGAGVAEDDNDKDETLFTLGREVDSYFLAHDDKANDHSLYVVWIGSNNYLAIPDDADKSIKIVNDGIVRAVKRLADSGAQHIMVVNLPDLGRLPAAMDFDAVEQLTYSSLQHNKVLKNSVVELRKQYPTIDWIFMDVHAMFDAMLQNPANYGITNMTDTCYEAMLSEPSSHAVLKMVSAVKSQSIKDACEGYLFFDPVHPAAIPHQVLAEKTKLFLKDTGLVFGDN